MTKKFKYLVGYSIKKRVAKKSFLVANIILGILIIALCNIGNIISAFGGDFSDEYKIYLYDETAKDASTALIANLGESQSVFKVEKKDSFDETKKEEILKETDCILVLKMSDKGYLFADCFANDLSLSNETTLKNAVSNVKYQFWLSENSELTDKINDFNQSPSFNLTLPEDTDSGMEKALMTGLSMVIIIPTFMLLIFMIQFIGVDIIEEKSSRSIEVIISNVPAGTHFASKIISTIIFMIIQGALLLLYTGVGSIVAIFAGGMDVSSGIPSGIGESFGIDAQIISSVLSKLPMTIVSVLLFILVGYTLYLVMIAVLSAMANSMEDYQSFQAPIMILLLLSFYIAIFGIQFDGSTFMKIMGYIPFFSPILAPVLYLTGTYSILEVIISFVVLAFSTTLVVYFGIPLYKASILDYSEGNLLKKFKRVLAKSKYVD